jgi:hypothetical protein
VDLYPEITASSVAAMKYLLMIYGNADKWASFEAEEWREAIDRTEAWLARYRETGEMLGAYGLGDAVTAKLVRRGPGEPAVTDGPYLETKEYMASFYLVDCESEARAFEIAADMPAADQGPVEVWPILHESTSD